MDSTSQLLTTNNGSFSTTNATQIFNEQRCKPFQSDTTTSKQVKVLSYCVLLLISVLGNSLLIAIIIRNKRMQTITNYLIANVAVSDLLITVLAVPRKITEIVLGSRRWLIDGLLGSALCKSVFFLQDITVAVSIFSLVAIAIDRYRGIVFPLRQQFMKPAKLCKIIIPLIWFMSMGLHAVYFYVFQILTDNAKTICAPSWAPAFDERKSQEVYYVILFVCLIAIPTCVVTFLYSAVILNLRRNGNARRKGPSSCMTARRLKEDTKVVRNIIAILIAFLVCVIPINVYGILFYFVWDWHMPCGMGNFGFAAFFVLYSNPSVNPCIYFILNDKYRQGLIDILKVLHIVRKTASKSTESLALERFKTFSANSA
ncbi:hypothetical protein ACROYT_G018814 [Oculina patagonica]